MVAPWSFLEVVDRIPWSGFQGFCRFAQLPLLSGVGASGNPGEIQLAACCTYKPLRLSGTRSAAEAYQPDGAPRPWDTRLRRAPGQPIIAISCGH